MYLPYPTQFCEVIQMSEETLFGPFLDAIMAQGLADKFLPGASAQEIRRVEQELGIPLPKSYVKFLSRWNGHGGFSSCHLFGGVWLYGTGSLLKENQSLFQLIFSQYGKPIKNFVAFCHNIVGNWFCFDTSLKLENGEYMIVAVEHEGCEYSDYNTSFANWINAWAMRGWEWEFWPYPKERQLVSKEQLRIAVRLDPELVEPRIDLGLSFYDVGESQAAIEEITVALSLKPPRDKRREWRVKRAKELLGELTGE